MKKEPMKVEIWSDIVCPFCYIGKRKFEQALEQFEYEDIDIQWHSFELQPGLKTDGTKNQYEHLAESKGWTLDYSKKVHESVTEQAKAVGLDYHFDIVIPANSFNAHRLSHLAAAHGLQNEMEERLFAAYFTEGKNIDDDDTLVALGKEIGLPEVEIREMLKNDLYADEVKQDITRARQVGVQGVPFFVINHKYAVSGAQPTEVFLNALQQAYSEYKQDKNSPIVNTTEGTSCSVDDSC